MKRKKTGVSGGRAQWTVSRLRAMEMSRVRELFTTLEAPEMAEMNGEYEGCLLDHGNYVVNLVSLIFLSNPISGWWLGKAFKTLGARSGYGYNWYVKKGQVTRGFHMRTEITQSGFDGRPSFRLIYAHYRSLYGNLGMVDEIRRLSEGVYLGVGMLRGSRMDMTRASPFVLCGPVGPFVT